MTIHWSLLVPAVLLLLFPADRLLSSRVELRSFESFQNLVNSPRHRPWWWVPGLWLDPWRGLLGTLLLRGAVDISAETWELTPKPQYALLLGILAAGVLSQTVTRRGDGRVLLAPVGFVAGVVGGLTPWTVGLLTIVTGMVGLFALRHLQAFFAFAFVAVCLLGAALGAGAGWIGAAAGSLALPIIAGLVTGSTLEVPTRNDTGRQEAPLSKI